MKNNTEKQCKTPEENPAAKTLNDISKQLAMAFADENTPEAVKDCLRTIIIEAATEASVSMNWDDDAELSKNFPQIIEGLNLDYGRGVLHSIHAILIHDTKAFREFYDKRMDEKPEKSATETPIMSQEEMQRFISVIANAEHIQGDYVHNGFLCFFQSIYEAIKENPVEAQNLMFHLQQHVFNKLMWESFWAFDAHRKKAHLIFSSTEPFVYDDEEEESKPDVEEKPEADCLDLSEMSEKDLETGDLNTLANQISAVMKNDLMPTRLFNAMADELSEVPKDWRTPEAILVNLQEIRKAEAKND